MNNRYDAEGAQSTYEPGSDELVLANKLGITDSEDMDDAELVLLEKLYLSVLIENLPDRRLTVQDLKDWHRRWLGNIYSWAGDIRSVNMGKVVSSSQQRRKFPDCSVISKMTVLQNSPLAPVLMKH